MATLRRLVLLRHGETVGESSIRFHGAGDVALSEEGREQARAAARAIGDLAFDLVVSSPLARALRSAEIVVPTAVIELEPDFREIHFGRWEGLTREEIRALDPTLYDEWQSARGDFVFPGGESRRAFRERVSAGLARLLDRRAENVLVVAHKGVVRAIAEELLGSPPGEARLGLGSHIVLRRDDDARWHGV